MSGVLTLCEDCGMPYESAEEARNCLCLFTLKPKVGLS